MSKVNRLAELVLRKVSFTNMPASTLSLSYALSFPLLVEEYVSFAESLSVSAWSVPLYYPTIKTLSSKRIPSEGPVSNTVIWGLTPT